MRRPGGQRRRRGRPRLSPEQRRISAIYLRLTDQELSSLRRRAEEAGVCASCLARDLALYAATPLPSARRIKPAALGRLARVGHLLNQAMHQVNAGGLAPDLRSIVEETYGILAGLLHGLEVDPR